MASPQSFPYQPLDPGDQEAFRLLKILPGEYQDPISCTIGNVSLTTDITFFGEHRKRARASLTPPTPIEPETSIQHKSRRSWRPWFKPKEKHAPLAPNIEPPVTPLYEFEDYECLSYTWGEDGANIWISLNKTPFRVSPNLESALRHLRHEMSPRTIWIDAICIDQTNDREKANQIRFMQQIYANADQVVVWLGDSSSDSDLAFSFSLKVATLISPRGGIVSARRALAPAYLPENRILGESRMPEWSAVHALIERSWWTRAWIVQEVVSAKTVVVQCGKATVQWDVLGQAIVLARISYSHYCGLLRDLPKQGWRRSSTSACQGAYDLFSGRTKFEEGHGYTAIKWLPGSRRRFCRLPHDRIYSILGLTSEKFRNSINIDYNQPLEEVFKAVVKGSIEESGSFDIINYAQHSVWFPESPSWMPDWRLRTRTQTIRKFQDPMRWPPTVSFSPDVSEMTVRGKEIAVITESNLETRLIPRFNRRSGTTEKRSRELDLTRSTGWHIDPDVLEDLYAPAIRRWNITEFYPNTQCGLNVFLKVMELKWNPRLHDSPWHAHTNLPQNSFNDHKPSRADLLPFYHELEQFTISRTVVATQDFLGLAWDFAERGDVIYIISGFNSPVVLRPCGEGRFRFIGEVMLGSLTERNSEMFPVLETEMFPDLKDITLV